MKKYKHPPATGKWKLKADRPHPRNYPHTPTDYRHTDNHLRLLTVVVAPCCTRQSRAPNIDRCVPEIWPRPLTLTHDLDPDLWPWPWPLTLTLKQCNIDVKTIFEIWPWPLTYDLDLQSQPALGQGQPLYQKWRSKVKRFKQESITNGRTDVQTDRRTDGRYQVHYLPRFAVDKY